MRLAKGVLVKQHKADMGEIQRNGHDSILRKMEMLGEI